VRNATEETLAQLREDHPGWKLWVVYKALGGVIWCGKPQYETTPILNADSPEELTALIAKQQS
jgi:hypothetical protein